MRSTEAGGGVDRYRESIVFESSTSPDILGGVGSRWRIAASGEGVRGTDMSDMLQLLEAKDVDRGGHRRRQR